MKSIDLFAGCGGLSLGLHDAGWEGLFAIEKDPMAFETLRANLVGDELAAPAYKSWPSWLPVAPHNIDDVLQDSVIRRRLDDLAGSVDLVAGGPPCQGFSVGGARNGADERNHLVHRLLEMVELTRPKVALIENVEGITRPFKSRPREAGGGSVAAEVVEALAKIGYVASYRVLDASMFGVPQVRRRAVIVGFRDDLGLHPSEFFSEMIAVRKELLSEVGLPIDRPVTAEEALEDLSNPSTRVPTPDSPLFESSPYVEASKTYARYLRGEVADGVVPDSHRYSKHGPRIQALYELAHETQAPGRLSKAFLLANDTKKDKKVLIDRTKPVSTITTHPDEFIHYAEPRNITVREMARLQSFPDWFEFKGRYTINGPRRKFDVARCSQVGNAVPPLLARAIGRALRNLLEKA